jgi:diguanylate cyclase (GGDEF)-like protein
MIKILVIEDEELIRVSTMDLLAAEGFEVLVAENGRIGVQVAREQRPDLIICDVLMPELDGHGVIKTLRQDQETATIPFIFLTAMADKVDWRRGMELGADDYLTKPFTFDELLSAIDTRLKRQASIVSHFSAELEQAKDQVEHLTYYHTLTNLPNRYLLRERFNELLDQATGQHQAFSVLSVSLDQFERVYDGLDPSLGDLLIQAVAARLQQSLKEIAVISQWQTAQFVILLPKIAEKEAAARLARFIQEDLAQPFKVNGLQLFITASIGLCSYPADGRDIDTLVKKANAAVYQKWKTGGNVANFFVPEVHNAVLDRLELGTDLHQALERSELQIYYQPQVALCTGKITGLEALIRWKHPTKGMVSPAEFIPLAEETGLIIPIGEWVLRTACLQLKKWHEKGITGINVAVNVSANQFNQLDLSRLVARILKETGLEPRYLELELTETTLVENFEKTLAILNELKETGIRLAIDDFGTGYSSLNYLKQLSFHTLKIDRGFIQDLPHNASNNIITLATLQMARQLDLKVIAEGVEKEEERAFLVEQKCDEAQGFFFYRPLPADKIEELLLENQPVPLLANHAPGTIVHSNSL